MIHHTLQRRCIQGYFRAGGLGVLLLLAGCARLPDYARPHFGPIGAQQALLDAGFTYRRLTLQDFQAASLPEHLSTHADTINAYSCIQIRPTRDSRFRVTAGAYRGQTIYFGSVERLAFEAVMLPACSWWNPRVPKAKSGYVLQHEQIHLALMELAARRLTREAQEFVATYLAPQATYAEARDAVAGQASALAQTAMERALAEHTAFDQETSLYFDPHAQQRWWERVEAQLQNTAQRE